MPSRRPLQVEWRQMAAHDPIPTPGRRFQRFLVPLSAFAADHLTSISYRIFREKVFDESRERIKS